MSDVHPLPTSLEGITAEWLTSALSSRAPGTVVGSVEVESVIWGTATKVFLRAEYEAVPADGPPTALCLKDGFDDTMRSIAGIGYQVEARFYRDIAGLLGDAVPRCWYAAEDSAGNQGLVIVDDLREAGVTFGGPSVHFDVDQVAHGLATLASVHGRTWQRKGVGSLDWLSVGSMLFRTCRPIASRGSSTGRPPASRRGPTTSRTSLSAPLRWKAATDRGTPSAAAAIDHGTLALALAG